MTGHLVSDRDRSLQPQVEDLEDRNAVQSQDIQLDCRVVRHKVRKHCDADEEDQVQLPEASL